MIHLKLIRFISPLEAEIHQNAFTNRDNDSYRMPVMTKEWNGRDSFGKGWCFFILDGTLDEEKESIIEHYRYANKYSLEIELDIDNVSYQKYFGYGFYRDRSIAMKELHIPMIPYWKIKPEHFKIKRT